MCIIHNAFMLGVGGLVYVSSGICSLRYQWRWGNTRTVAETGTKASKYTLNFKTLELSFCTASMYLG